MKLITIFSLLVLIALISCQALPEEGWCGSSYAPVSIVSTQGTQRIETKGRIIVPRSLEAIPKEKYDENTKVYTLREQMIKKHEEGLVMTLEGPANPAQLNKIFKYDEDSENEVYIPYSFITSITKSDSNSNYYIELLLSKLFDESIDSTKPISVKIEFLKFDYSVNICKCQLANFQKLLENNVTQRRSLLTIIKDNILKYVSTYYILNNLPAPKNPDDTELKLIIKTKEDREKECSKIRTDITDTVKKISDKEEEFNKIIVNCDKETLNYNILDEQLDAAKREVELKNKKIDKEENNSTVETGEFLATKISKSLSDSSQTIQKLNTDANFVRDKAGVQNSYNDFLKYQKNYQENLNKPGEKTAIDEIKSKCNAHMEYYEKLLA